MRYERWVQHNLIPDDGRLPALRELTQSAPVEKTAALSTELRGPRRRLAAGLDVHAARVPTSRRQTFGAEEGGHGRSRRGSRRCPLMDAPFMDDAVDEVAESVCFGVGERPGRMA